MLYSEIITLSYELYMKHTNSLCGRKVVLVAFAETQKARIIFVMSVSFCLSLQPHEKKNSVCTGRIFIKNYIFEYFSENLLRKFVLLKSDKNKEHFT